MRSSVICRIRGETLGVLRGLDQANLIAGAGLLADVAVANGDGAFQLRQLGLGQQLHVGGELLGVVGG
jgi:hypothetical protein